MQSPLSPDHVTSGNLRRIRNKIGQEACPGAVDIWSGMKRSILLPVYGACQGQGPAEHLTAITSSKPQMPYPLQVHEAQSDAFCAEKLEWRYQSGRYQLVPLISLNSQALYLYIKDETEPRNEKGQGKGTLRSTYVSFTASAQTHTPTNNFPTHTSPIINNNNNK